jgi:hypothetical protein
VDPSEDVGVLESSSLVGFILALETKHQKEGDKHGRQEQDQPHSPVPFEAKPSLEEHCFELEHKQLEACDILVFDVFSV